VPGGGLTIPGQLNRARTAGACSGRPDCIVMALRNAAEILAAWPGVRKTVILISPGHFVQDLSSLDAVGAGSHIRDTLAAMQRANVVVHQFDPHGLEVEQRPLFDFGLFSDATGGRTVVNTNTPVDLIPTVFQESSSYYLLGVQPAGPPGRGAFRRIEVRVSRPGVRVRTRAGYFPPAEAPEASVALAGTIDGSLSGGLPSGDWPLSLAAVPFASTERPGAAVAVIARADLPPEMVAARGVDLVVVAFDERWRQAGVAMGRFVAAEGTSSEPAEMGIRLNLPPGRYEIRAGVSSASSDRKGSVYTSITVPDFSRERLSLSGLTIAKDGGGAVLADTLTKIVPVRPTLGRTFSARDRAVAALRVYQGGRRRPEAQQVRASIEDDRGAVVYEEAHSLEPSAFGLQRSADYKLELPLELLVAGEYLLSIEVGEVETAVRRHLRFAVQQ